MFNKEKETLSRDGLIELQTKRLLETIKRAYNNIPFYKELYDNANVNIEDIRGIEDLEKLPFFKKGYFRDTYPYGLISVPMNEIIRLHASSGTTGKPTIVAYTKKDIENWSEIVARSLSSAGVSKESIVQVSYGYGLFTGGIGIHYGVEKLGATVVPTSAGNTQKQLLLMKDLGVTTLACTPSYALHMFEELQELGISPDELNLKTGVFGAEAWTEEMRKEIESKFGIKAFDIYGLSEAIGPGVAIECEAQNGLHIFEDHFLPEIIDPETGEVLPEGEVGELVLTSLKKEAMPIVRYRTGDITSLTYEECSCGRTHARMLKPDGRSDDMVVIRGVNVFPTQVESVLLNMGFVNPHYQLIVDRKGNFDTLEIKVEAEEKYHTNESKKKIESKLGSVLGISSNVELLKPKTLERNNGKAKRLIDLRKSK